jgi:hypothetical protein
MKKALITSSLSFILATMSASAQVSLDIKGQTQSFNEATRTEVFGYPFLLKDWADGVVVLDNNKNIPAKLKVDVYADHVLFQDKNGQGLELKNKYNSVTLNTADKDISDISPLVFVSGYPETGKQSDTSIYQLIADGKVKLLKYYKKEIAEHREDTSSVITSRYRLIRSYYIFGNNRLRQVLPNKKSFLKALDDRGGQLESYLQTNNINFDGDMELKKLFDWYNALK